MVLLAADISPCSQDPGVYSTVITYLAVAQF
jgi:hypothetical protein